MRADGSGEKSVDNFQLYGVTSKIFETYNYWKTILLIEIEQL
jgi:hypothetical protein